MPDQQHVHQGTQADPRHGGLIDAGNTPLLFPPAYYQEESSLRSTLPQCDQTARRADSVFEQPDAKAKASSTSSPLAHAESVDDFPTPSYTCSFTPINKPPKGTRYNAFQPEHTIPRILPTDSDSFTERYDRRIPQLRLDFVELDEKQLPKLDKDEDRVYHLHHERGGAYSGTFLKSSPANSIPGEYKAWIQSKLGQKLEALRTEDGRRQERRLRSLLQQEHCLLIEQTMQQGYGGSELKCNLQGCLSKAESIPHTTYYVISRPSDSSRTGLNERVRYCLRCLEWLWKADHMKSFQLPHPGIILRRESSPDLVSPSNLGPVKPISFPDEVTEDTAEAMPVGLTDNTIDREDFQDFEMLTPEGSRSLMPYSHMLPDFYNNPFQPTAIDCSINTSPFNTQPPLRSGMNDSPRSTNSDGEWLWPPTRLQHIASFIIPGDSITSKEDKATLWLWKAASQAQLQWERHLRKYRQTQAFYDGRSDDDGRNLEPDFKIEETEYSDGDIEDWESLSLLKKEDCYGNDLSEVLYMSRQRQNEG